MLDDEPLTTVRSGFVIERGHKVTLPRGEGGGRDFSLNSETRTIGKSGALSASRIYRAEEQCVQRPRGRKQHGGQL